MVRMAGILDQIEVGYEKKDPAGLSPKEQITLLSNMCHDMVHKKYTCLNKSLLPEMKKHGVEILSYDDVAKDQKKYINDFFRRGGLSGYNPYGCGQQPSFPPFIK